MAPDRLSALSVAPMPLVMAKGKIAVHWSMKCACSHVALWAFACEGLLPAVRYYHAWPHKFRLEVYVRSRRYEEYRDAFAEWPVEDRVLVSVTRDPVSRLISMFRHLCRHRVLWPEVGHTIGIDMERDGLSIEQFDDYLGSKDLRVAGNADRHFCSQDHPILSLEHGRQITVNVSTHDLRTSLSEIARSYGLNERGPGLENAVRAVEVFRNASDPPVPAEVDRLESHPFRRREILGFPKEEFARSPLFADMARRHYGSDFDMVATYDSAGELFHTRGV